MSDFAALAYLTQRQALNGIRQAMRDRQRLLVWVFFAFAFAMLIAARILAPRPQQPGGGMSEPFASLLFSGLVFGLGVLLLQGAAGRVGAFTSLCDALFLTRSALSERGVIIFLQLRKSAMVLARGAYLVILYALVFRHSGRALPMIAGIVGYLAATTCAGIPMLKLRVRFGPAYGLAIGYACIAAGIIPAAVIGAGWLYPAFAPAMQVAVAFGGGGIVTSALLGNWLPIAVVFALAAAFVAAAAFGAADLYPELYQGSVRAITVRTRIAAMRAGRELPANLAPAKRSASSVGAGRSLIGAWAILWKALVPFRRSRSALCLTAGSFAAAIAIGAIAAHVVAPSHDPARPIVLAASLGFVTLIVMSTFSTLSLAADLSKPIWWLSASTLRERLYVWLLSRSWFAGLCIALAVGMQFCLLGMMQAALISAVGAVALVLYANAVNLLLYGFFPSRLDQRGPGTFLRPLMLYALLLPVAITVLLSLIVTHSAHAAAVAVFAVACVEIIGLVEAAAAKLRGIGASLLQAETA